MNALLRAVLGRFLDAPDLERDSAMLPLQDPEIDRAAELPPFARSRPHEAEVRLGRAEVIDARIGKLERELDVVVEERFAEESDGAERIESGLDASAAGTAAFGAAALGAGVLAVEWALNVPVAADLAGTDLLLLPSESPATAGLVYLVSGAAVIAGVGAAFLARNGEDWAWRTGGFALLFGLASGSGAMRASLGADGLGLGGVGSFAFAAVTVVATSVVAEILFEQAHTATRTFRDRFSAWWSARGQLRALAGREAALEAQIRELTMEREEISRRLDTAVPPRAVAEAQARSAARLEAAHQAAERRSLGTALGAFARNLFPQESGEQRTPQTWPSGLPFLVGVVGLLGAAAFLAGCTGGERPTSAVVVLIDTSASTGLCDGSACNIGPVAAVFENTAGTRLVPGDVFAVEAVTAPGASVLFRSRFDLTRGSRGLRSAREQFRNETAARLGGVVIPGDPAASAILRALWHAGGRLAEIDARTKSLVVMSDLRDVGSLPGWDFEVAVPDAEDGPARLAVEGLLPDLSGVRVVACRVHRGPSGPKRPWTPALDARLRAFYQTYFRAAGAREIELVEHCDGLEFSR